LANYLKLCLCSDTTGDTIVDTFYLPAIALANLWRPITVTKDGGGNLGSSIKSIALYVETDVETKTVYFDNISACTTNGLNLQKLISKSSSEQGGSEFWYGLQSINGTTLKIDCHPNLVSEGPGYDGASETVATYMRDTIKTAEATFSSDVINYILSDGIILQGGYNTSTVVQEGESYFDGLSGGGYGMQSAVGFESYYVNMYRYNSGIRVVNTANKTIKIYGRAGHCTSGLDINNSDNSIVDTDIMAYSCTTGVSIYSSEGINLGEVKVSNNSGTGFDFNQSLLE